MKTLDERFWEKVRVGDGCWEWQAALNSKGYGSIGYKGKVWLASRVSALLAGMDIEGKHVCHHCDNPNCVRPGHLFVGTHQDNMRDRDSKGRGAPKDGR